MTRYWTLNDEIQHHKHGFIAEAALQMDLSYKKNRNTSAIPVASISMDLNSLLKRDLVRVDDYHGKKGFRLRFVHDVSNHGIYIQREHASRRMYVAQVPATHI
jgi:hypothetical protein